MQWVGSAPFALLKRVTYEREIAGKEEERPFFIKKSGGFSTTHLT